MDLMVWRYIPITTPDASIKYNMSPLDYTTFGLCLRDYAQDYQYPDGDILGLLILF